jgi:hypothetical protein
MYLKENYITKSDLDQIEKYADKLFAKVGVDIEFTRHFLDRVNDERNRKQITVQELIRLFKQTYAKHGRKIPQLGPDAEAVIKDMRTDINMPFVLNWNNRQQEFELVAKTIMRKKNFKTPNPELYVEKKKKFNEMFNSEIEIEETSKYSVKTENVLSKLSELKIFKPNNPKGIPRTEMPQIKSKDYDDYLRHMKDSGISNSVGYVNTKDLKAIQSEFSDSGIIKALQKMAKKEKPVIVSKDGFVIDGNHRWLAYRNTGRDKIPALIFNGSKNQVLDATKKFNKTYYKAITD